MVHVAAHSAILASVSAVVCVLQSWCVSRFGPIWGGVLGTIPTTIIPASIVLAFDVPRANFEELMFCVPLGVFLNIALLFIWRAIPMSFVWKISMIPLRMVIMILGSVIVWAIMALVLRFALFGVIKLSIPLVYISLAAFGLQLLLAMLVTVIGGRRYDRGEGKIRWQLYLISAFLGAATGASLVFLSSVDDMSGGLLLAFPVILITSLSSLASTYAETLPMSATTAMIGGSVSTSLFTITFSLSLPILDSILYGDADDPNTFETGTVALASFICWVACVVIISIPVLLILRCLRRSEKQRIEKIRWDTVRHHDDGEPTVNPDPAARRILDDWEDPFEEDGDVAEHRGEEEEGSKDDLSKLFASSKAFFGFGPQIPSHDENTSSSFQNANMYSATSSYRSKHSSGYASNRSNNAFSDRQNSAQLSANSIGSGAGLPTSPFVTSASPSAYYQQHSHLNNSNSISSSNNNTSSITSSSLGQSSSSRAQKLKPMEPRPEETDDDDKTAGSSAALFRKDSDGNLIDESSNSESPMDEDDLTFTSGQLTSTTTINEDEATSTLHDFSDSELDHH